MKKILVLDDNIDILEMITEVLSYEHFNVRSLAVSEDILSVAIKFCPDLIILDYRLQNINGGKLCRIFKDHAAFKNVPVIICTAYLVPTIELIDFGCDAIIAKRFDIYELVDTVNQLIAQAAIL